MTVLCEPDAATAAALAAVLGPGVTVTHTVAGAASALIAEAPEHRHASLILGPGIDLDPALALTSTLRRSRPSVAVVLLVESWDRGSAARATTAGVREVVDVHGGPGAIRRARTRTEQPRPGTVLAVLAGKAGCGSTTVAANLAAALTVDGRRVCAVDLDYAHGDLAAVLAVAPAGFPEGTVSAVVACRPGLDCLAVPASPGYGDLIQPQHTKNLLGALAMRYDVVVADLPGAQGAHALAALDLAAHHIVLATPERPAVRALQSLLDTLDQLGHPPATRSIVVNREDLRAGLSGVEVGRATGRPVAARLPSTPDIPASINQGVPLAQLRPRHPFSLAISRVAAHLLADVVDRDAGRHQRRAPP